MAREMLDALFKGWFAEAVASTFVVAVVLATAGGVCAFLLRSHVRAAVGTNADETATIASGQGETALEGE